MITMENNEFIYEDFEREHLKEIVYLLEQQWITEQEVKEKKPAEITIIDKDKILEDDKSRVNVLPF